MTYHGQTGMRNYYAIRARGGKEFQVEDELNAMGLNPWLPRALTFKPVKEKGGVVWYDRPYLYGLMFCVIPAIYWPDVVALKHVMGKPIPLNRSDIEGIPAAKIQKRNGKQGDFHYRPARPGLNQFKRAVEAEYAAMERQRDNAEYQCPYTPGQALRWLDGDGIGGKFKEMVKRTHDRYAKVRMEMDMMGRVVEVEVDPDRVAAE